MRQLWSEEKNEKLKKYRNTVGAELTLIEPFLSQASGNIWALGEIWWAEIGEGWLRQEWLVTRDGLAEAGYELIDGDEEEK